LTGRKKKKEGDAYRNAVRRSEKKKEIVERGGIRSAARS
jgi:hypothetical protein